MAQQGFNASAWDAAAASVAFDEVRTGNRAVWWLQSRPTEAGRVALLRWDGSGPPNQVTAVGVDVGSGLHGYGGGAYAVDGDLVWYVDAVDGCVRLLGGSSDAQVVVHRQFEDEHYGDLIALGGRLLCVRGTRAGDELVEVWPDGRRRTLVETDGFLGSPRPSGSRLAWLRWDRDRMPWDGSELVVAQLGRDGVTDVRLVCGSREESLTQPCWDDAGRLWFVSDRTGWWNLYAWNGDLASPVAPIPADVAVPQWEAGYQGYGLLPAGGVVFAVQQGPRHQLTVHDAGGIRPLETPYTSFKPYMAVLDRQLITVASSPTRFPGLVAVDVSGSRAPRELSATPTGSSSRISTPNTLRARNEIGQTVNALVYPPAGAASDWHAPVVVRAHPGPTSSVNLRLDWHVQFLTNHGFAVADVDYRGSSGYGREFRRSLYHHWGTFDVQDCTSVAELLIEQGHTRTDQIFITGASAGGYTALQAVSGTSIFTGAVAHSAIIDPLGWTHTAPRWQRPHATALAGPAGAVRAERITRPVLLLHGAEDHIAPLADVKALAAGLHARSSHCQLIVMDSKHGLSTQQATARALEAEVNFYKDLLTR